MAASDSIPSLLPSRFDPYFVVRRGKRRHIPHPAVPSPFLIFSSRHFLPRRSFPPHYISSTITLHLCNSAVSAAISINATLLRLLFLTFFHSQSFLPFSNRYKIAKYLYPLFFLGQKTEHTGESLRHSPTSVFFLDRETPMAVPGCSGSLPS